LIVVKFYLKLLWMIFMGRVIERVREEWCKIGRPFVNYTAAQTVFNAAAISVSNGWDVYSGMEDAGRNLPFIAGVNLVYAKCVDSIARGLGKYGRLGANLFSMGVTGAFYGYGLLTNDNDPAVPTVLAGAIGLVLTNRQVSGIRQEGLEEVAEKDV
jgi:hypothetical protein